MSTMGTMGTMGTNSTHVFAHMALRQFEVNGVRITARVSPAACGARPTLLLLHGFPQTHVMWQRVADLLLPHFDLVLPDLRGYGDSSKPVGEPDHSTYSKRAMAQDMVAVMDQLGVPTFGVCGHDRGGRVAHRLALDHPERVNRLCVIDIAPTLDMYQGLWGRGPDGTSPGAAANVEAPHPYFLFAQAYYHWFHLTQPAPLPEAMIGGNALAYLHHKLGGWGTSGMGHLTPEALTEYERCFCQPDTIHAVCEDYRASASIDLTHDRISRAHGQRIMADTLVLWGARGVVQRLFDPLALWQTQCAARVTGQALAAGHFIPEELPQDTAALLQGFFTPAG